MICILRFKMNDILKYFLYIESKNNYSVKEYIDFYNSIFQTKCLFLHAFYNFSSEICENSMQFLHEKELKDPNISEKKLFEFINSFQNYFSVDTFDDSCFLLQEEVVYSQYYILCFQHFSNGCILLENSNTVQDMVQSSRFLRKIKAYEEYDIIDPKKFQAFLNLSITSLIDVEDKLDYIESLCDIGSLKNVFFSSQQKLQYIILKHFETTNNEKDKIKCSDFLNKLEHLGVSFDKKILNNVLNHLQVEKKRFTNGFHWVRIKPLE